MNFEARTLAQPAANPVRPSKLAKPNSNRRQSVPYRAQVMDDAFATSRTSAIARYFLSPIRAYREQNELSLIRRSSGISKTDRRSRHRRPNGTPINPGWRGTETIRSRRRRTLFSIIRTRWHTENGKGKTIDRYRQINRVRDTDGQNR